MIVEKKHSESPTPHLKKLAESPHHRLGLIAIAAEDRKHAFSEFVTSFRRLETLAEDSLISAVILLADQADIPTRLSLLEEAVHLLPYSRHKWLITIAEIKKGAGDLDAALNLLDQAIALHPDDEQLILLRAIWNSESMGDTVEARALYEEWGRQFADPLTDQAPSLPPPNHKPNGKIRLGYVSGDFKNHAVRYFIEPFLRLHDRTQFEVHAFMTLPGDTVTEWLKPLADRWHQVDGLSDSDMYALIRSLEIDVLVDLSGHTDGGRLAVFARRAAPVQVTWFGFMRTLGMKAMDWRLTDAGATPWGVDAAYTERLYRLDCMTAYSPPLNCEEQYDSPWRTNGYVTMGCLNHSRKISGKTLELWGRILHENPSSGLMVISSGGGRSEQGDFLSDRLKTAGLPMQRVSVIERVTMAAFMKMASIVDFALDTYPASGGTTTLHALWMGLPTLTVDRRTLGAEQGATAAIQLGCGLDEAVVRSEHEFILLAGQWIQNPEMIDYLRSKCRPGLENSSIMKHKERVREVEVAFLHMLSRKDDIRSCGD